MKIILFLAATLALTLPLSANAEKPKKMTTEELQEYINNSEFKITQNGDIEIMKVVDAPDISAEDIYKRSREFFTYTYGNAQSVIQSDDPVGHTIIGKGIYNIALSSIAAIKVWHLLRIDAKDNRARVIITLTDYEQNDGKNLGKISSYPPLGEKGSVGKKTFIKSCAYSLNKAQNTISAIEKAIKTDNNTISSGSEDW